MKYILQLIFFVVCLFVAYAIFKERKIIGCNKLGIDAQCHYDQSLMYMKTDPHNNDLNTIFKKLRYILNNEVGDESYNWRKILIFSFIITFFLCVAFCNKKFNIYEHFLVALPIIFLCLILYERLNYYHYTKIYEINGLELLEQLQMKF